ncbi:MAG: Crp/Fnr family transcriptional regulator [Verrucomicrobiota bacterium]
MESKNLRAVGLFNNLTNDELVAFTSILSPWEVGAGAQILAEGQIVTHLYLIDDGAVQVRRMAQGREMLLGRLGPGAFFGEVNLFDPGTATASIWAMKPTKMAVVDFETMRGFLNAYPGIGYKIVSVITIELAKRLRKTNERLVNVVNWNNEEAPSS